MNRILFHSLTIPPDQVSTGKLVADIASKFKEKKLDIKILASTPQYRFDSKHFSDSGLKKIGKNKYVSSYKDVEITHLSSSKSCLLYTSPSPRDVEESRMPSSA